MTEAPPSYVTARLIAWRERTDAPLLVLAVGSLPLLALEVVRDELAYPDRLFLDVVNIVVFIAFAVDYTVELVSSSRRRDYVRAEWLGLVVVVAQGVALMPSLAGFGVLRALRAARLIRLATAVLRGVAIGGAAARGGREMFRRRAGSIGLGVAALTWITSAVAFTIAEDVGEGQRIGSFGDALWWSLATITTVGYGDIFPVTAVGRVVGGITMIVGISVFALVTAKVAQFLVRND